MPRQSFLARLLWSAFAVLQLAGPAAAGLADARLEAASNRSLGGHIEDHSTPQCPRVHTGDCALCRFLTRALAEPEAPAIAPARPREIGPATHFTLLPLRWSSVRLPPSRGPPVPVSL
ncbi:MAG TPA: hypothetical protein VEI06_17635 [Gemmatimonadaceae bacterium]|nr:hypothetical protein [Gemmatimonadaceae bacterium]